MLGRVGRLPSMRSWSARSSSDFGYEPAIPQCPNLHVVVVVSDYGVSAVECLLPRVFGCGVPSRFNHNQWFETTLAFAEQAHPQPRWQGVHLNVANPYRIVKPAQLPPAQSAVPPIRLCRKLIRHCDVLLAVQESGEGRSLAADRGPIRSAGAQVLPIAAADRRRSRCASLVSGLDRCLGGRDERGRRRRAGAGHGAGHRLPKLAATARRRLNSIPGSVCRGDGRVGDGGRRG